MPLEDLVKAEGALNGARSTLDTASQIRPLADALNTVANSLTSSHADHESAKAPLSQWHGPAADAFRNTEGQVSGSIGKLAENTKLNAAKVQEALSAIAQAQEEFTPAEQDFHNAKHRAIGAHAGQNANPNSPLQPHVNAVVVEALDHSRRAVDLVNALVKELNDLGSQLQPVSAEKESLSSLHQQIGGAAHDPNIAKPAIHMTPNQPVPGQPAAGGPPAAPPLGHPEIPLPGAAPVPGAPGAPAGSQGPPPLPLGGPVPSTPAQTTIATPLANAALWNPNNGHNFPADSPPATDGGGSGDSGGVRNASSGGSDSGSSGSTEPYGPAAPEFVRKDLPNANTPGAGQGIGFEVWDPKQGKHIHLEAPTPEAKAAVEFALQRQGDPYLWGGKGAEGGIDCSGLTRWAYLEGGDINLPVKSTEQQFGAMVPSADQLRAGDLLVWEGHVAMYLGEGRMIEAAGPNGTPVQINDLDLDSGGKLVGMFRPSGPEADVPPLPIPNDPPPANLPIPDTMNQPQAQPQQQPAPQQQGPVPLPMHTGPGQRNERS